MVMFPIPILLVWAVEEEEEEEGGSIPPSLQLEGMVFMLSCGREEVTAMDMLENPQVGLTIGFAGVALAGGCVDSETGGMV
jgi:hypothetical protein